MAFCVRKALASVESTSSFFASYWVEGHDNIFRYAVYVVSMTLCILWSKISSLVRERAVNFNEHNCGI